MLEYVLDGGPIMVPLVFLSILAVSIIIDRLRAFRAADVDSLRLRQEVNNLLEDDRLDDAIRTCEQSQGPVAAVLLAGLSKYRRLLLRGHPVGEIELNVSKTMEDFAPKVLGALEKRLNLLMLVGGISPLLGMTGTVTGMIKSFDKMAATAGLEPGAVAGGISEALITTAAGLVIAIPAVVAHNIFSKHVEQFELEIDDSVTELIDYISLGRDA